MTTDLTIRDDDRALRTFYGTDDPDQMLALAAAKARVLAKVVENQGLFTKIGNKKHVHIEGWTFLGSQVGVFPVPVWSRKTETGWEARVEARTMDGAIVGAAEAQCDKDEEGWANKPDYALRSMAQTRAASKALRLPLGYIMVLAGFEATPAEEMIAEKRAVAQEHWCAQHQTIWFKRGNMKNYAHPMGAGEPWCNEPSEGGPPTGRRDVIIDTLPVEQQQHIAARRAMRAKTPPVLPEAEKLTPPSRLGALMGKRDEFAQAYADAYGWDLQRQMTTAEHDDMAQGMRVWLAGTFKRNDPDTPHELSFDPLSPEEQDTAIGMLRAQARGAKQKAERETVEERQGRF